MNYILILGRLKISDYAKKYLTKSTFHIIYLCERKSSCGNKRVKQCYAIEHCELAVLRDEERSKFIK